MSIKDKTFISIGDFIDLYHKIRIKGISYITNRVRLSRNNRIKVSWEHTETVPVHWQDIPEVRERKNKLITGSKSTEFTEYVYQKYFTGKNGLKVLSPGCGIGTVEIQLARYSCFSSIEAFDISKSRIQKASRESEKQKLNHVHFYVKDVHKFDFGISQYDLIVFNDFLHHIHHIESVLTKIKKSLTPNGMLVINEYVGPNRFQWTKSQLQTVNNQLSEIPMQYKRLWKSNRIKRKQYRPGLIRMILSDPSEAIVSENILPVLKKYFSPLEIKDLGGNISHLLFKDIAHHFLNGNDQESKRIIELIFNSEDHYLRENESDFIFGVFSKL